MKIVFHSMAAAEKFISDVRVTDSLEIRGENYFVRSYSSCISYSSHVDVILDLIHEPKRTYPTWEGSEEFLKDLRQKNTNLKKFVEEALAVFVSSGQLATYLSKYDAQGMEK